MRALPISVNVLEKLRDKHQVSRREVEQCFEKRCGGYLEDTREQHRTDPPTQWFVAPTNQNRLLKIVFTVNNGAVHIKMAYPPNDTERDIYQRYGV